METLRTYALWFGSMLMVFALGLGVSGTLNVDMLNIAGVTLFGGLLILILGISIPRE